MAGPDKQLDNLTPRDTGINKDCDQMSDFLRQQEHFQSQFDNKNPKTKPKDSFFE